MIRLHWDCDVCHSEHVEEVRELRRIHWAQCPRSQVWFRLDEHEAWPSNKSTPPTEISFTLFGDEAVGWTDETKVTRPSAL